jgi:hypothetical protein
VARRRRCASAAPPCGSSSVGRPEDGRCTQRTSTNRRSPPGVPALTDHSPDKVTYVVLCDASVLFYRVVCGLSCEGNVKQEGDKVVLLVITCV